MNKNLFFCFLCLLIIPIDGIAGKNYFWKMCEENSETSLECEEVGEFCSQAQAVSVPEEDRPTMSEQKKLKGCTSDGLYYGYGNPSDPVNARKCAYFQIDQNQNNGAFDGLPILMTVYANGEGVEKNIALALKFACEDESGAPAEFQNRVLHLNSLRRGNNENSSFDYCDATTSGMMMGFCASRDAEIRQSERTNGISELMVFWSDNKKIEFEKMRLIWHDYLKNSVNEVDQSGSARGAFVVEDREAQEEEFFDSLLSFDQDDFPAYKDQDFIQADREMNLVYKKIQRLGSNDSNFWGTVTKHDIKESQKAWLKYRDAWVVFAKQKYPSVSAAAWKTWLTLTRTARIKSFLDMP